MTQLPFHNAAFDAVIAIRVFHLVDGWQQAVRSERCTECALRREAPQSTLSTAL